MSRQVLYPCASSRWVQMTADAKRLDKLAVQTQSRFGHVDADNHLCAMQRQQEREGFMLVEVSTNIYGFCVRDTLNDGAGVLHSSRDGGSAKSAIEFARRWHAEAPDKREVIIGYINPERSVELATALAAV